MDLTDLTPVEAVFVDVKATTKKTLFQEISHRLADLVGVESRELFAALIERERLGSTGMGRGIAIPHCRLPSATRIYGALVRSSQPIEFEAVDARPVDLFYFLIAPECAGSDHLKALARVSRMFRDDELLQKLRGAKDANAIHAVLGASERTPKAA